MQFLTEHTITTLRGIAQAPSDHTADEISEAVSALLGAVQGGTPLVVGYDPIAYLTDAVTDDDARSAIEALDRDEFNAAVAGRIDSNNNVWDGLFHAVIDTALAAGVPL